MTEPDKLYQSWTIDGSYLNYMLDCGNRYNRWVELALRYLPVEIFDRHKEDLVFISTAHMDACRVARYYCDREIILLSERILPKMSAREDQPEVRYFIFVVLHEIVHAVKKHKSPKFDRLFNEQSRAQEQEADMLAFNWFNAHVSEQDNEDLKPLAREEVEREREKNRRLMERLYTGG